MSVANWLGLCRAAGINTRQMKPVDVYQLAGRIIQDAYLTKLSIDNNATREFVMQQVMTEAQLETLRARVQV